MIFLDKICKANAIACMDVQLIRTIAALFMFDRVLYAHIWVLRFEVGYHTFKFTDRSVFSS